MSESALEAEVSGDTATFNHFGRDWTVPTRRHHRHIRETKRIIRAEGFVDADDVARIYLPDDQYEALVELDLSSDDLDAFATKIAEALGVGDSGNSTPSSASS
jgi:hypothetical protein